AALWALLGLRAGSPDGPSTNTPDDWPGRSPMRHTEIYQATGMVMVQLGVTPEMALSRLRAYAFVHDRAIDEVVRDVVARTLRFEEEDPR
ncbi:MAG: ANTAR domain-containing protein, partial [Pseudonocardia sp.]|nr:ANTAR domain-containing protein [Pseudonocardia sp.]